MKILFVCEGNVNRSQMAGTIFKAKVPSAEVSTAGVLPNCPGELVSAETEKGIIAMKEIGYDMSQNRITKLTPEMVEAADHVVLMGPLPGATVPEYLQNSPKLETWDVPDPGYNQISTEGARDMVVEHVSGLVKELGF